MNILITGGCGYVGYSLVQTLLKDKTTSRVIVYDNLSRENLNFFFGEHFPNPEKLTFIHGDILDNYKLKKTLQENLIDTVVHLAAKVSTPYADFAPHSFDQNNNWGTAALVDAIIETPSVQKVIYTSSISVYGNKKGDTVTENSSPSPKTFYGVSKLKGEKHIRRLFPQRETYIIRAGNVFGYNPCIRIDSVLNKFIFEAHLNNRIEIHGSGTQNRAFVHVDALADTIKEVVKGENDFPSLFNCYNCNLSILDLADTLQSIYPDIERMYIEQHIEMRSVRAASNVYKNDVFKPVDLIPLLTQFSSKISLPTKMHYNEASLEK